MADNDRVRYVAELPADIGPFKELLQEYSHIPPEEVEAHIHKIVSESSRFHRRLGRPAKGRES